MMNDELKRVPPLQFSSGVLRATLVLCILAGIACRFIGLNWDGGFHLHPDERFLTMTTNALRWPHSWSAYFITERAPLNPYNHDIAFFVYGQLPLMLTKAAAGILHRDNYDALVLVGRLLSAFFDTLSFIFIFLIGRKIGGSRWLGLLAAALFSLTALNIQQSHFFVVDTFAVAFLTAASYFCLCAFDETNSTFAIHHSSFIIDRCLLGCGGRVQVLFGAVWFRYHRFSNCRTKKG
jgi:dolichyl-phosphate-mannose--protein O-mannosyl transferase